MIVPCFTTSKRLHTFVKSIPTKYVWAQRKNNPEKSINLGNRSITYDENEVNNKL